MSFLRYYKQKTKRLLRPARIVCEPPDPWVPGNDNDDGDNPDPDHCSPRFLGRTGRFFAASSPSSPDGSKGHDSRDHGSPEIQTNAKLDGSASAAPSSTFEEVPLPDEV